MKSDKSNPEEFEKNSLGMITSTKLYLWLGNDLVDERSNTNIVQKRFYPQGEQQVGVPYYYFRDHLGSVREMLSLSGNIVSRVDYDVYGRSVVVSGTTLPTFQWNQYYSHQTSGLDLSLYRPLDVITNRWLTRDPIGENGGLDLYGFVLNDPVVNRDRLGLQIWKSGTELTQAQCDKYCKSYCDQYGAKVQNADLSVATLSFQVYPDEAVAGYTFVRTDQWTCKCKCCGLMASPFIHLRGSYGWLTIFGVGWKPQDMDNPQDGDLWRPATNETLHWDGDHEPPILPHWDYKDGIGGSYRIFENGICILKGKHDNIRYSCRSIYNQSVGY